MRRIVLCLFAVAVVAFISPAIVSADYVIEAEDADALDHALVTTGQGPASGGYDVSLQNPWDQKGSAFFWLDAGSIAPGDYTITANLWSQGTGRWIDADLQQGTHLIEDGSWQVTSYGIPTSGQSSYDPVVLTTEWGGGDPSVFTIAAGQDYTLRIHGGTGGDMAYIDNFTLVASTVPEPSTLALLVVGIFGLLAYAWRKQK